MSTIPKTTRLVGLALIATSTILFNNHAFVLNPASTEIFASNSGHNTATKNFDGSITIRSPRLVRERGPRNGDQAHQARKIFFIDFHPEESCREGQTSQSG